MRLKRNEHAYRQLREKILVGQFLPGAQLSDIELANDMGMSRTPVREAVIRLANEGFCEQVPGLGTYVRRLTEKEMRDLFELRIVLESHAAKRAAELATPADIEELLLLCHKLHEFAVLARNPADSQAVREHRAAQAIADVQFHLKIVKISGNEEILKIIDDLAIMSRLCVVDGKGYDYEGKSLLKDSADTFLGHYRIARAIRRRNGDEAAAMVNAHLTPKSPKGGIERLLHMYRNEGKQNIEIKKLHQSVRQLEKFGKLLLQGE